MRTLRVVSDGTAQGTRLLDALTGEDLRLPVRAITWHIDADSVGQALITVSLTQIEAEGILEENDDGAHR